MSITEKLELAEIEAAAIERAVEAVLAKLEKMTERFGPPSEGQIEGIKGTILDFRMYASDIRQQAKQSGGG